MHQFTQIVLQILNLIFKILTPAIVLKHDLLAPFLFSSVECEVNQKYNKRLQSCY